MRACALNALSYYSFYVINGLKGRVSISCPQQWYHLLAISFKSNIFCKQTTLPPALLWVPAYCKMPPVSPKLWQHILLCSHITTQYTAYTQKTLWCLLSFLFLSHPVSCLSFPFPFHPPLSFKPLSSPLFLFPLIPTSVSSFLFFSPPLEPSFPLLTPPPPTHTRSSLSVSSSLSI